MVEVPGGVATMVAPVGDVAMVEVPGGVATMVAAVELGAGNKIFNIIHM